MGNVTSVKRFGKNSPLLHSVKSVFDNFESKFGIWPIVEPTLAIFMLLGLLSLLQMAEYKTHTEHELKFECSPVWPGDQIVFSIFGHFQQWDLPKSIQIAPKWVENFAQNQINLK